MGLSAGFCMYDVIVKKFAFAISSPDEFLYFLANVNSRSRLLYAVARPSVVCNVRAPYSAS